MEHYYETITATLDFYVKFDFEALLRKHFGLKGEYNSEAFKRAQAIEDEMERMDAFDEILEKDGPKGYYTDEAWEAWDKALAFLEDLRDCGVINDEIYNHISAMFCNNA